MGGGKDAVFEAPAFTSDAAVLIQFGKVAGQGLSIAAQIAAETFCGGPAFILGQAAIGPEQDEGQSGAYGEFGFTQDGVVSLAPLGLLELHPSRPDSMHARRREGPSK